MSHVAHETSLAHKNMQAAVRQNASKGNNTFPSPTTYWKGWWRPQMIVHVHYSAAVTFYISFSRLFSFAFLLSYTRTIFPAVVVQHTGHPSKCCFVWGATLKLMQVGLADHHSSYMSTSAFAGQPIGPNPMAHQNSRRHSSVWNLSDICYWTIGSV